MSDALEMFRTMRPAAPEHADVPSSGRGRDLHDLAMVPGSPSYRARIPPPPCYQCGEDHVPGQSYDHSWTPEPPPLVQVHDEPVSASVITRRPIEVEQPSVRRVALYVGRGDTYVVSIEESPEWDAVQSFKVAPEQVLDLINFARALGVKVADKTGGDLVMLESEYVSKYAQAHGGRTPPNGSAEPRRQGPTADRETAGESAGAESPHGGVSGGRGERRRTAR